MSQPAPVTTLTPQPMLLQSVHDSVEDAPERPSSGGALVPMPLRSSDDAELVAGIIARRPNAIARLYDSYAAMVRGLLTRTMGSAVDVDDLTQDAFMTVIDRCDSLRDPTALRSFIMGVAFRVARNALRRRAIRRFVALDSVPEPPVMPHDTDEAERVQHVYMVLDKLDTDSRLALIARHVEGHGLAEAADICGCSLATFKRRLAKAEKRFEALSRCDSVLVAMAGSTRRES